MRFFKVQMVAVINIVIDCPVVLPFSVDCRSYERHVRRFKMSCVK